MSPMLEELSLHFQTPDIYVFLSQFDAVNATSMRLEWTMQSTPASISSSIHVGHPAHW